MAMQTVENTSDGLKVITDSEDPSFREVLAGPQWIEVLNLPYADQKAKVLEIAARNKIDGDQEQEVLDEVLADSYQPTPTVIAEVTEPTIAESTMPTNPMPEPTETVIDAPVIDAPPDLPADPGAAGGPIPE